MGGALAIRPCGGAHMRPRGEVRQALGAAAQALALETGPATWRDIAARAQVGFDQARETVKDMARAGELVQAGVTKRAHCRRWMRLYEPAENWSTATTGAAEAIGRVMRTWR